MKKRIEELYGLTRMKSKDVVNKRIDELMDKYVKEYGMNELVNSCVILIENALYKKIHSNEDGQQGLVLTSENVRKNVFTSAGILTELVRGIGENTPTMLEKADATEEFIHIFETLLSSINDVLKNIINELREDGYNATYRISDSSLFVAIDEEAKEKEPRNKNYSSINFNPFEPFGGI